jgi:hypothetical protein
VLIISKAGFNEDAVSVLSTLPHVEVFSLRRSSVKAVARAFLPPEVDDNNYFSAAGPARKKMLDYRRFLKAMWPAFDPGGRFGAVAGGNFAYFAEREVAAALEAIGVPFLVLHKENLKTPGREAFWERVYRERRGPFFGRKILVYNEIERDLMIRSGVAVPASIEIAGMPRLDAMHRWRSSNAGTKPGPVVLFFSFLPETGMPRLYRKGTGGGGRYVEKMDDAPSGLDVPELCTSVHRAVLRLAVNRPEISVVIKTKGRGRDRREILGLLGAEDPSELPPNLAIVHDGSPADLICRAAVVCGFNSTALLESLAAGKPVVAPVYAEAGRDDHLPFILDLGDAAEKAGSPEVLTELLEKYALEPEPVEDELSAPAKKALKYWLGNDDGKAAQRAAKAFDAQIT